MTRGQEPPPPWLTQLPDVLEDDVVGIVRTLGPESIVMGSDWPHPEGLKQPADFADLVSELPEDQQRLILRENGLDLVSGG